MGKGNYHRVMGMIPWLCLSRFTKCPNLHHVVVQPKLSIIDNIQAKQAHILEHNSD